MHIAFKGLPNYNFDKNLQIGIPANAIEKRSGYIQFILPYGINKLYRYLTDKLYPARSLDDDFYEFPIIKQMGYFDWTSKPTWKNFKTFLGKVVYEYDIRSNGKVSIMILNPLHYKDNDKIDKKDISLA